MEKEESLAQTLTIEEAAEICKRKRPQIFTAIMRGDLNSEDKLLGRRLGKVVIKDDKFSAYLDKCRRLDENKFKKTTNRPIDKDETRPPKKYTQVDYENWEGNWELIEGKRYAMVSEPALAYTLTPAPGWYHQKTNLKICYEVQNSLRHCNDCDVNMPVNWKISEDTIVQPDVVVVCRPFDEGLYLTKTPEIIFEILSPTTSQKDRTIKYNLYRLKGVKYYVIVAPIEKKAEIFINDPDYNYKSVGSFINGIYRFETSGCPIDFDFGNIW